MNATEQNSTHTPTRELIEAGMLDGSDPCECGEATLEQCDDCCTPKVENSTHTPAKREPVLKYADQVLKSGGGNSFGGFNSRIMGHDYSQTMRGLTWGIGETAAGWSLADKMVRDGKLYAVHNFHHSHECKGHAFPYGGSFVCNDCGRSGLEKEWWTIKCYADGNAWCCVGPDFEDLQSSDCFAFGDTYDAAIAAYGDLMVAKVVKS